MIDVLINMATSPKLWIRYPFPFPPKLIRTSGNRSGNPTGWRASKESQPIWRGLGVFPRWKRKVGVLWKRLRVVSCESRDIIFGISRFHFDEFFCENIYFHTRTQLSSVKSLPSEIPSYSFGFLLIYLTILNRHKVHCWLLFPVSKDHFRHSGSSRAALYWALFSIG